MSLFRAVAYVPAVLALFSACRTPPPTTLPYPKEPVTLRVGTYNIHGGFDASGDVATTRIAEELNMKAVFGTTMRWMDRGQFGNAVLTSLDVVSSRNIRLPGSITRVSRKALEVHLRHKESGLELLAISAHFSLDGDDRLKAARWLSSAYRHVNGVVVVGVDLNDQPESGPASLLANSWLVAGGSVDPVATYPAGSPTTQIDYLLVHPSAHAAFTELRRGPASASDHRLLSADLTITAP